MQNRKRDTDVQNRLLDSVGEGEGGMFQENSIETCILSKVKQITSPGWIHETNARTLSGIRGRPSGIGWRGRWEGGSGWGTHVYPWLIHVNVWQKPLQYCKVISLQLIFKKKKKEIACQCRRYTRYGFNPWVGKILWRRKWQPSPVFLPGESHGQMNLVGYSL